VSTFASTGLNGILPLVVLDAAQNLTFVHACETLRHALRLLRDQHRFTCDRDELGDLVQASKHPRLPWQDYRKILTAVTDRNAIAHKGQVLPRLKCSDYIGAIKAELSTWSLI